MRAFDLFTRQRGESADRRGDTDLTDPVESVDHTTDHTIDHTADHTVAPAPSWSLPATPAPQAPPVVPAAPDATAPSPWAAPSWPAPVEVDRVVTDVTAGRHDLLEELIALDEQAASAPAAPPTPVPPSPPVTHVVPEWVDVAVPAPAAPVIHLVPDLVVDEPVVEEPVVEEPVVEEPVAEEPAIEEPVAEKTAPVAPTDVDEEVAAHWDLWAGQIGRALRPDLEALKDRVPTLVSAMVTTVDGAPMATVGLTDEQVTALTASAASLHGAAGSIVRILGESTEVPDVMTVHHGQQQTVVVTIPRLLVGTLLLWVTADAASLGVLLIHARNTASSILGQLGADGTGGPRALTARS